MHCELKAIGLEMLFSTHLVIFVIEMEGLLFFIVWHRDTKCQWQVFYMKYPCGGHFLEVKNAALTCRTPRAPSSTLAAVGTLQPGALVFLQGVDL